MCLSKFVRKDITVADRITIASLALSKDDEVTISHLARAYKTSRKFISEQINRAEETLAEEFSVKRDNHPVVELSKERIVRAVRSLALDCHSSVRGIVEHLEAVWGIRISEGKVAQILKESAEKAEQFNKQQDLSSIRIGAHDEIFSQRQAVLAGVEVHSTYLYVLESPGGRDSTHWGLVLLDKQQEQKLELELVVADAAKGLRSGAGEVYPKVIIRGDAFHAIDKINEVLRRLENRAYDFLGQQYELERQALKRQKKGKDRRGYNGKLYRMRRKAQRAIAEFDLTHLLSHWMKELLQVSGYDYQPRRLLYDWIVGELKKVQAQEVKSLVTYLRDEKEALLEFVKSLEEELSRLKERERINEPTLTWLREQRLYQEKEGRYWKLEGKLLSRLGKRLTEVKEKVAEAFRNVVRASSIVETINSLLRRYFFLRKSVGQGFLPLVQFYLNTRKYRRSGREHRIGKSPLELLTGKEQPHWLDLLDSVVLSEPEGRAEAGVAQAA